MNRYNHLYRYYRDYLVENNLDDESQIPESIKQEMMAKSYNDGKQLGRDWFRDNMVDALNLILLNDSKISKDFKINERTIIYKGDESLPEIEYVSHEYWLKKPEFVEIKKALNEVLNLENSIIDRAYNHEAKRHISRIIRESHGKTVYPGVFKRCSKQYLIDESVEYTIIQRQHNNILYFYCNSCQLQHHIVFEGKNAKKDSTIQKYLSNELKGIINGNWVTVKDNRHCEE